MIPETAFRRWVSNRCRTGLADFCPIGVPGILFSPTAAADVSPFTVQQVSDTIGYGLVNLNELSSSGVGPVSGMIDFSDGPALGSTMETTVRLYLDFTVPKAAGDFLGRMESYIRAAKDLFVGIRYAHSDPDFVVTQNLRMAPREETLKDDKTTLERRVLIFLSRVETQKFAVS